MDATFKVEGFVGLGSYPAPDEIGTIEVKLVTDGLVVSIARDIAYPGTLALTAKGFDQLAEAARALLGEATRAWEALAHLGETGGDECAQ